MSSIDRSEKEMVPTNRKERFRKIELENLSSIVEISKSGAIFKKIGFEYVSLKVALAHAYLINSQTRFSRKRGTLQETKFDPTFSIYFRTEN